MFGDIISVDKICGAVDVTAIELTKEDSLNVKSPDIISFNFDKLVGH
jgi:hypothetical protein